MRRLWSRFGDERGLRRCALRALATAAAFIAPSLLLVLAVAVVHVGYSELVVVQALFYGIAQIRTRRARARARTHEVSAHTGFHLALPFRTSRAFRSLTTPGCGVSGIVGPRGSRRVGPGS